MVPGEQGTEGRCLSASGELAERIRSRTATVGVLGLGYVGLPLALLFELAGYSVVGFGRLA